MGEKARHCARHAAPNGARNGRMRGQCARSDRRSLSLRSPVFLFQSSVHSTRSKPCSVAPSHCQPPPHTHNPPPTHPTPSGRLLVGRVGHCRQGGQLWHEDEHGESGWRISGGGGNLGAGCCRRHSNPPFSPPQQIKSALNKTAAALDTAAVNKVAWLNRTAETKLAAVNATLSVKAG